MGIRRALAVTAVLLGLVASGQAGAAESYRLDGKRTTVRTYRATLTETSLPVRGATTVPPPLDPVLEDCTPGACDLREFHLALPKGTTWGSLNATLVVPRTLAAAYVLYNAKGEYVRSDDIVWLGGLDCCTQADYTLEIDIDKLRGGRYTLAVVNRGGLGEVKATVQWLAHPPDRKAPRKAPAKS